MHPYPDLYRNTYERPADIEELKALVEAMQDACDLHPDLSELREALEARLERAPFADIQASELYQRPVPRDLVEMSALLEDVGECARGPLMRSGSAEQLEMLFLLFGTPIYRAINQPDV